MFPCLQVEGFLNLNFRGVYPVDVQILHGLGDGVEHGAGFPLREELLPQDLIQQLSSLHQLRHQEHRAAVVIHLQQENTNRPHNVSR